MKIALCCIGRRENRYAIEYVEYYKSIGFDKIFIYDNNHDGEEHFEEVLQQYVDEGFVEITNYRNKTHCQLESYQDCYNKHKNEYDWIAFFDFDEFLTFAKDKDAKEYLSRFNGYDIVKVNWMVYTDSNLIRNDGRRVLERFATPMEYDKRITYPFPENNHIKSIVKGGLNTVRWGGTPHIPLGNSRCCDSIGNDADGSPFQPYNFELAYLRHYPTKTIDEFYSVKVQRGYPDGHKDFFKQNDWTVQFFKYNEKTEEKLNYLKNLSSKVALCCIGRLENQYAVEFVEWYKRLGFDKIFIYDNNHDGEERFEDVLQQYVDEGFVEVIDFRNVEVAQTKAYNECYAKHGKEYDWIMFFDFDEFLILTEDLNVKQYLSKFNGYDIIKINWMLYGDNDLVYNDKRPLNERFTKPVDYDFKIIHKFPENFNTKSCIRGGLENIEFYMNPHIPINKLKTCNADGEKSDNTQFHPYSYKTAYLKHFTTKTIEEYVTNKIRRGTADRSYEKFLKTTEYTFDAFFKYNTKTDEKVNFIKSFLGGKINVFIVNFNTQDLTDACIRSLNKNTPNTKIYIFDNSDKQPFINTFSNVTVIDNTKGQIIDFNEWLKKYKDKTPMSNNYGSAKHCYTIEKFMEMFDDNFIMIDSDALVKKDISELYDDKYMYVGEEIGKVAFWKPRVVPYILFINNRMCKEKGVHFFDENRCTQVKRKVYYDTGASFLEDASKYEHKTIKCSDYIEHFGAGSWQKINRKGSKKPEVWLEKYKQLWDDNNLDLFICTHKDFKQVVSNRSYRVLNNNIIDESKYPPGNKFYSEIMTFYYVADNIKLRDYVGFCHYRRYFSFMDDIPNMDEVFKENDVIIGKPKAYGTSIRQFYDHCHNIDDLDIVENIVKEKYPDYYNVFERYMSQKMFIQCNMFIMRREDFLEYIEFIRTILDEYLRIVGTDIYKRIEENKSRYLKSFSPNNTVEYQYRIGGYLAERLTGVFILKKFNKARCYEIKVTEKKY